MISSTENNRAHLDLTVPIDVDREWVVTKLEIITHTYKHLCKRKQIQSSETSQVRQYLWIGLKY